LVTPMTRLEQNRLFSDGHPHYTPGWLSEKLASHVPKSFAGRIIDPACGAGNLLAAAAVWMNPLNKSRGDLEFGGSDVSIRAVRACRKMLSRLLPLGNYSIERADFLKTAESDTSRQPVTIVMNPPFRGYGELGEKARARIARTQNMKGRFNLGYAFVHRAVTRYRPDTLVSLLPSNWIYSRASSFRSELDALNGSWEWEDVGDGAFRGVCVHVGILVWRARKSRTRISRPIQGHPSAAGTELEVHQGVATGSDALFCRLAESAGSFGRRAAAVRGRDVGRGSASMIWVPPIKATRAQVEEFIRGVGSQIVAGLRARSCVTSRRRQTFEYHEAIPKWFLGHPKLLLPEIVTRSLRVELDTRGKRFPLHSAIAIRVRSDAEGRALKRYLMSDLCQRVLFAKSPRLSGGAVRLQVGAIREAVIEWEKRGRRYARTIDSNGKAASSVPAARRV
jgi:hypothetical protein